MPSTVTWPSAMASSSADCVFGEARLISSPSTMLAKTGPGRNSNASVAAVPHGDADDVGGQQVGGELDAAERRSRPSAASALARRGLADAGHVLEQEVALGDEAEQRQVDDVGLALDDPADVGGDGAEQLGERRRRSARSPGWSRRCSSRSARGATGWRSPSGQATRPARRSVPSAAVHRDDLALAIDIGGTKLAVGARRPATGAVRAPGPGRHPGRDGRRGAVRRRWPGWSAEVARRRRRRRWCCGVGCGGPMTAGGEHGVAGQHPGVAGLPAARPAGRAHRAADLRRQRRQGAGPRRGLGGRGAGASATTSPWWCRPGSAAASCSTAGCSTAPTATPATSATSSSSPTATGAAAGPAAASRPRRRARPSPPSPGARPPRPAAEVRRRAPARLVGRAVASVANLLDLRLAVVAGSVALGFGDAVLRRRPGRGRPLGPPRLLARARVIRPGRLGADGPARRRRRGGLAGPGVAIGR